MSGCSLIPSPRRPIPALRPTIVFFHGIRLKPASRRLNRIPIVVDYTRAMTEPLETTGERRNRLLKQTGALAAAGARTTTGLAIRLAKLTIPLVRLVRPVLWRVVEALLAVIIVFEEWGWRPLAAFLAGLTRFAPVAKLEALIAGLPPYPALGVFAVPVVLLLPLKLVALAWIAAGHVVWATLLFIFAKLAGTAIVARVFHLTQPALMQLSWFARLHDTVMPWKHALVERIRVSRTWRIGRVVKFRGKHITHAVWHRVRPLAEPYLERVRGLLKRG